MQKCDEKCPHRSVQYDNGVHGYCRKYNLELGQNLGFWAHSPCDSYPAKGLLKGGIEAANGEP